MLALSVALPLVMRLAAVRGLGSRAHGWLWGLVAVNLLGHVALDGLNWYGVHPFYPFESRWYYGDAVFVFEPFVWLVLGVAAACNAQTRRVRTSIVCLLAVVFVAITAGGLIPPIALVANLAAAGAFLAAIRDLRPRPRAAAALVVMTVFVVSMFGLSRAARLEATRASGTTGDRLDVIVSPDPGMPLCWSVIIVTRNPGTDTDRADRGTLSLAPAWFRPDRCASDRLAGSRLRPVAARTTKSPGVTTSVSQSPPFETSTGTIVASAPGCSSVVPRSFATT